jgi:hypothetical protein
MEDEEKVDEQSNLYIGPVSQQRKSAGAPRAYVL